MVFVTADGDEDDPDRTVFHRADGPTTGQVREALLSESPIHYGTYFILSGAGAQKIVAICTSGPIAQADEPGEFLVYVDGALVAERASRHAVLERFVNALRT